MLMQRVCLWHACVVLVMCGRISVWIRIWSGSTRPPEGGQQLQVDGGHEEAPEGRPVTAVVAQAGCAARAQAVVGAEQVPRRPLDKDGEGVQ